MTSHLVEYLVTYLSYVKEGGLICHSKLLEQVTVLKLTINMRDQLSGWTEQVGFAAEILEFREGMIPWVLELGLSKIKSKDQFTIQSN